MKIIIVGAGAAGLIAASELASIHDVVIIEARNRIGGRMHTIRNNFTLTFEEGAEFIHGDLPLTIALLTEAEIHYYPMKGNFYHYHDGNLNRDHSPVDEDRGLNRKLRSLEKDMTVKEFLESEFDPGKDEDVIHSVKKFVEGFDSADYERASALALRDEWLNEDDWKQYRIAGGYKKLYDHLKNKTVDRGGKIILEKTVIKIKWGNGKSEILCSDGDSFIADKVIVTVPTGVLKDPSGKAHIRFEPQITELDDWVKKSGYGSLIKVNIEFEHPFWDNQVYEKKDIRQAKEMAFMFSDEKIPTWWSQLPDHYPMLTGWLGGPDAKSLENATDSKIYELSLDSLSSIFRIELKELRSMVKAWHVKNWTDDPFTKGAYAYKTPETSEALKNFRKPYGDTLFFAGEALYDGKIAGTVEGALNSGLETAKLIL